MALHVRAAASLAEALELTPNQINRVARAHVRIMGGAATQRRKRGSPEEFKAMILGMVG